MLATIQGVLVHKVVKRVGEARLIPVAIFCIALGIGLVPFAWSVPTLLVALGVLAVGMGFNNPSLTSMVSRLSDADDQGGTLGLASSLASLGRVDRPGVGRLPLRRLRHDHAVHERVGVDVRRVCGVVRRAVAVAP